MSFLYGMHTQFDHGQYGDGKGHIGNDLVVEYTWKGNTDEPIFVFHNQMAWLNGDGCAEREMAEVLERTPASEMCKVHSYEVMDDGVCSQCKRDKDFKAMLVRELL
jgi:hypothetical protein